MVAQPKVLTGIVVSAGRMLKAVKVRTTKQRCNNFFRKHFQTHHHHRVSDPTSALRLGDIIRFAPWRTSKNVTHTVTEILAPYGLPIDERPAIMSEQERVERWRAKRAVKAERRETRRKEAREARDAAKEKVAEGSA